MDAAENRSRGNELIQPIKKGDVLRGDGLSPSEKKSLQDSIEENREALILMARR